MTREYRFIYSRPKGLLLAFLACLFVLFATILVCVGLGASEMITSAASVALAILTFRLLRKYTSGYCTARITEKQLEFDFGDHQRVIAYGELISFNVQYGRRGTSLVLKNTSGNLRIFTNSLVDQQNFADFCEELVSFLDSYKERFHPDMIHAGSVFAKKWMLYFIVIATVIYFCSFVIETPKLRIAVGIGGGWFLLIMWIAYFNKRKITDR